MGNQGSKTLKTRKVVGTPYDDAFRTMTIDCSSLLIPVINEVFGKQYTGKEEIVFHPNEHFANETDGTYEKKITDSFFSLLSFFGILEDRYVFECQSADDNSMIIRIVEYSIQSALDDGNIIGNHLNLDLPNAAVLYLRSGDSTPDRWAVGVNTPGGSVSYEIPTMKMSDYSLNDIFEKKLYFLLPFYLFNREELMKGGEEDERKLNQLLTELTALNERLERQMEQGDITAYQFYVILEMAKVVSDALAADKPKVKEGVDRIMGGKVLEHRAKDIKIEQQKEDARAMYADGIEPERIARILKIQLADVEKMLNLQPQKA